MTHPDYNNAPFVFFNGKWGNDPQPPILHREWYYPLGRGVFSSSPSGAPLFVLPSSSPRFVDEDPYREPWPPCALRMEPKRIFTDKSMEAPSLASLNGRLYLAWTGTNNDHNLNVMSSTDNGRTFANKYVSPETSDAAPTWASHNGKLYIAWRGRSNERLNVAMVYTEGNRIDGFTQKKELQDKSTDTPSLASLDDWLYLAWRGTNNDHNLNVMSSTDDGLTFRKKCISPESSDKAADLNGHNGRLYLIWRDANARLNLVQYTGR